MFGIEELKRYSNNLLYEFQRDLRNELKYYKKVDNNTMAQITLMDINTINYILELRGEKNDR